MNPGWPVARSIGPALMNSTLSRGGNRRMAPGVGAAAWALPRDGAVARTANNTKPTISRMSSRGCLRIALKLRRAEERVVIQYCTRAVSFKRLLGGTPQASHRAGALLVVGLLYGGRTARRPKRR